MTQAPDHAARAAALDPARSFIVKAPAGSGKTSLLVARYLSLLALAERPEEVVAITFTRKAAAEMRARLLAALALADAPAPRAGHERALQDLARAAAARDRDRDWQLARDPQRLAIHTIDALCGSLARRLPVLSGFGGSVATLDQPGVLYRGAARRVLSLLEDPELAPPLLRVLDHLDGNVAAFETLLAQMLACREQWLRHLRLDQPAAWRRELEEGLEALVASSLAAVRERLPGHLEARLVALAAAAGGRAASLDTAHPLAPLDRLAALPGTSADGLSAWKALAELLLTARGELRKRPAGGVFSARDDRAGYDAMRDVLQALEGQTGLVEALGALRMLPPPRYADEQWQTLLELFQVLRLGVASLRLEFAAAGAGDFAEQIIAASQALGEEHAPTDLALVLDYHVRHLLVDEFQDTSVAHFEIVRKLTAGWSPGDGHSLFLVGDPMQSIYRFREAEVGLFLGCFAAGLDTVALEPLALSANFRAQAGLVRWVNDSFPALLPTRDDPTLGAVAYEPSEATRAEAAGESVQVHAALDQTPEEQAAAVAAVVARLRAEQPGQGIAILLRARSHGEAVVAALDRAGLRWRGVDLQPLYSLPAVQQLHALASALLHPLDRISWLAVLRAPWVGLELDDLEALAGGSDGAVAARLDDPAALRRLSRDGGERVARAAPLLLEALSRVGRDRLARLVGRTWTALGGPACLGAARLEDTRRYLALLAELERASPWPDPDELAARARELYAVPEPGDVDVEIMTIHKAKGLEFDVVLLPALERGTPAESPSMLAWSEAATPLGPRLLLAPLPPPEGEQDSPLHAFVRRVERDKRELESARLLYVACTRARRQLHLFASAAWSERGGAVRAPRAGSLLGWLWPVLAQRFEGLAPPSAAPAPAPAPAPARLPRLPGDWQVPCGPAPVRAARETVPRPASGGAADAATLEFSWAGQTARHVGTVAHTALRRISRDGPQAWDRRRLAAARPGWQAALADRGVPEPELAGAVASVADAVARTLDDARGRWLLDPGHTDARSEYAVSGVAAGALVNAVVDRTFVDHEGVRWIVDYKTGQHAGGGLEAFLDREQERYRDQLEHYAELLHALDPRPVQLALYFPALSGWRAWRWQAP